MKLVCHFVPALALVTSFCVSGCFLMHQPEGEPGERCRRPSGMVCCERGMPLALHETACPFTCPPGAALLTEFECTGRPPPPPPPDGGPPPPPDAGPLPLECPEMRADATCLSSFLIQPDVPFELPVTFDTCGCCAASECLATVDFARRQLNLTTTLCPDPCDCDACNTPRGSCEVPALPEGDWNVSVNGDPAFTLPVHPDSGLLPPPAGCATYAEPDFCDFDDRIELHPTRASTVCVEPGFAHDQLARISMSFECPGCGELDGTCSVMLEPRLTREDPPGGTLHITSTAHWTDCDIDCPPECSLREQDCMVPALEPGHLYHVEYGGARVLSFTAGDGAAACALLDGIVPG